MVARKAGMTVVAISCDQSLNSEARPMPSTVRFSQRGLRAQRDLMLAIRDGLGSAEGEMAQSGPVASGTGGVGTVSCGILHTGRARPAPIKTLISPSN